MTLDEMKKRRDGWLWWGRSDQPKWPYVRPIYDRMMRAPNGEMHCTFPQGGTLVYGDGTSRPEMQGPYELLYDVRVGSGETE